MKSKNYVAALRDAARVVDVPGTPRSLRLDDAHVVGGAGGRVVLTWSYSDPESYEGDPLPHGRRMRGELDAGVARGEPRELARSWWAAAQLAAARRYQEQIDADWVAGEPFVAHSWTTEEAWTALLSFLRRHDADVAVDADEIRCVHSDETVRYRIDPEAWAEYLNKPYLTRPSASEVVPVAVPLWEGLPPWATDELDETAACCGIVELVAGRIVGREPFDV